MAEILISCLCSKVQANLFLSFCFQDNSPGELNSHLGCLENPIQPWPSIFVHMLLAKVYDHLRATLICFSASEWSRNLSCLLYCSGFLYPFTKIDDLNSEKIFMFSEKKMNDSLELHLKTMLSIQTIQLTAIQLQKYWHWTFESCAY